MIKKSVVYFLKSGFTEPKEQKEIDKLKSDGFNVRVVNSKFVSKSDLYTGADGFHGSVPAHLKGKGAKVSELKDEMEELKQVAAVNAQGVPDKPANAKPAQSGWKRN